MTTANADAPRQADATGTSTSNVDARGAGLLRTSVEERQTDNASPRGCPFLVAEAGGWRLGRPSREHRCGAFSPPTSLAPEKQARLCLTTKHTGCATYIASLSARTERLGAPPLRRATRWGLARTTSVIEDPGGVRGRLLGAIRDRRRWPAVPALILITTLLVLAISGLRGALPAAAIATATPGQTTQAVATLAATTLPDASGRSGSHSPPSSIPSSAPAASTPATPPPSTAPAASLRPYRVKSGDTLGAIATRYGTTVAALVSLNNLSDAGRLSIGQVLLVP